MKLSVTTAQFIKLPGFKDSKTSFPALYSQESVLDTALLSAAVWSPIWESNYNTVRCLDYHHILTMFLIFLYEWTQNVFI